MGIEFIIGFFAGILVSAAAFWFIRKNEKKVTENIQKDFENIFGNLSRQALMENQSSFFEVAKQQFESLLQKSELQMKEKSQVIDTTLASMSNKLEGLTNRTTELQGKLEESNNGIGRLTETTSQLRQILSSSQQRGQWGERMVEDILGVIGLVEGVNYEKQLGGDGVRPDFTFKLPRQKYVNMDVKFPMAHYENFLATDNQADKESQKKQFLKDVREHIKTIEKRGYADPNKGSVDYVLMFIPNESIYYFINKEDAGIIDFALSKKIILCSPITLYAVLSLIRQAVSNFAMEEKAGIMQKYVQEFRDQWAKYVEKMESVGRSIGAAQKSYDELSTTRTKQLEKPMDKIAELQLGTIREIGE